MKRTITTALVLAATVAAFAQDAMTFAIPFTSGTESFALANDPWRAGAAAQDEIVDGNFYRHVHFNSIPDGKQREALRAQGVNCLFFEHGTTYVASIKAGTVFPLAGNSNLKGISYISARSKMMAELSFALNSNSFPSYAVDANGNVGIIFTYYDNIAHGTVLSELAARNIIPTYANANSHRVIVWMAASSIENFCKLPFVSAAELNDDVPQPDNNPGRTSHRDNWFAQDYAGGSMYNGNGVSVMLQDDGFIGPHIDYTGRVTQYIQSNSGNHGDHCGGTIMGGGNKDPLTRGMAWGAHLYVYGAVPYTGWDSIYSHYYTHNIVITSTSYSDGCNAGYTTLSRELDQQTVDMPNLIHVFSAGNNGGVDCNYGAGSAFGNITGGHKHSKNTIAVGNLDYLDNLNSSSSVGPVHDGRMKPEVCAVGTQVNSTIDPNTYAQFTGTSMSCPAVSGTFGCMYQAYRDIHGATPQSGLMKAVLMNTCDDLMNVGPDFKTGYGRINGRRALEVIEAANWVTDSIDNAQSNTHNITVPNGVGQLRVMIYWHDQPAAVNASVALVNNLNMQVTTPSSATVNPWVLNYTPTVSALNAPAVQGTDIRNNHEQITIDNPAAGSYTVSINGAAVPMGPQTYFVTWYFEPADELVVTYPNGGEGFAPGETQTIRWDAQVDAATVGLEYTADGGASWNPIASGLPADQLYYNWAVPTHLSGACRVRIATSTASDTSDADFTIARIPQNLEVAWSCPDSLCLKWDTIPGGTSYDVFMLGNVYMDSIGNSTTDSLVVTGLNNFTNTYWFSVRSRGPMNAAGRRAIAIEKTPGVYCPGAFDAAVVEVVSPLSNYFGCMTTTGVPVIIRIENPGLTTISNIPVSFSYDGGTPVTEMFTGTVAPFGTATYTFTATVNIGAAGMHSVETWSTLPNDISAANDTLVYAVSMQNSTTITPPYTQNFETFTICSNSSNCAATNCTMAQGWFNIPNGAGDSIDWRTGQGPTPTGNSGPSTDYAPGTATGNYLYLEASACFQQTASVVTPCIDLTTFQNPSLLFGYHMYGSDMGSLHIDVYSNGNWINNVYVRNGSQSQNWLQATVPLTAYQGQIILIRFRGITGGGPTSDMAFDAVRIEDPTATPEYNVASSLSVFPNPANGEFNFTVEGVANEKVVANVYDISGRLVFSHDYGMQYGLFRSTIDLSAFENGTYFLEVSVGESVATTRLVKED